MEKNERMTEQDLDIIENPDNFCHVEDNEPRETKYPSFFLLSEYDDS